MAAMMVIALINAWLVLAPARPLIVLLELMLIPFDARLTIVAAIVINVALSTVFEHWGTAFVAETIAFVQKCLPFRSRRRYRDGKAYKAVESGMR